MVRRAAILGVVLVALLPAAAEAAAAKKHACLERLTSFGVDYEVPSRPTPGIDIPVVVKGPLGGVTYRSFSRRKQSLVLDCSLVYSLALIGPWFVEQGWTRATYSSAYQVRNVRGTSRPSNHSFGLALDVHRWHAETPPGKKERDAPMLSVLDDYEMGLGDDVDCIGATQTPRGRALKTLWCRMTRSGHFRFIIHPDSDADHRDHFHFEVLPWSQRTDLRRVPAGDTTSRARRR